MRHFLPLVIVLLCSVSGARLGCNLVPKLAESYKATPALIDFMVMGFLGFNAGLFVSWFIVSLFKTKEKA